MVTKERVEAVLARVRPFMKADGGDTELVEVSRIGSARRADDCRGARTLFAGPAGAIAACLEARFAGTPLSGALARIVPDRVKTVVAGRLLEVPTFVKRVVLDQWFLHRHRLALGT